MSPTMQQPSSDLLRDCGVTKGFQHLLNEPPSDDAAPLYRSDEFRMFCFKVLPCSKRYCHDWTTCPFAHPSEKAKRRDPRVHSYTGVACPEMKKNMQCPRGDSCNFAHNVFEYWLHPSRYRTQLCNDGIHCKRKICFFAHTLEELRVSNVKVLPPELARYGLETDAPGPLTLNPFSLDNDRRRCVGNQQGINSRATFSNGGQQRSWQTMSATAAASDTDVDVNRPYGRYPGSYAAAQRLQAPSSATAGVDLLQLQLAAQAAMQNAPQQNHRDFQQQQGGSACMQQQQQYSARNTYQRQQQQQSLASPPNSSTLVDQLAQSVAQLQLSGALNSSAVASDVLNLLMQQLLNQRGSPQMRSHASLSASTSPNSLSSNSTLESPMASQQLHHQHSVDNCHSTTGSPLTLASSYPGSLGSGAFEYQPLPPSTTDTSQLHHTLALLQMQGNGSYSPLAPLPEWQQQLCPGQQFKSQGSVDNSLFMQQHGGGNSGLVTPGIAIGNQTAQSPPVETSRSSSPLAELYGHSFFSRSSTTSCGGVDSDRHSENSSTAEHALSGLLHPDTSDEVCNGGSGNVALDSYSFMAPGEYTKAPLSGVPAGTATISSPFLL